jgi:two-component system CheB/CheR fusion protein
MAMLEHREFDEATKEQLGMVRRNVELEARLIDDLLDLTRIARGKIELDRRRVDLCQVIERAVEVCKPDIDARRVHFGIDFGEGSYVVDADAARLQQVFWNLLKNAVKFTPLGGCIGIRCHAEGGSVIAEVNDSGIGIDPEALGHIFDAFEQGNRAITRNFGGLGLGLAISKALVELHGGRIVAHSEGRGRGTSMRVILPVVSRAAVDTAPRAAEPSHAAPADTRVLLVEDHGDTAAIMRLTLTGAGYRVETAGDVATALSLAESQRFDVVVSDLGLPDATGHDLLRELRSRGYSVPAIALSGYGHESDVRRSHEAGFALHLVKPIRPVQLTDAVARVTAEAAVGADAAPPDAPTAG